ncbi:MAG: peptidoglycan editing factor PgeF [Acidimicrobiales bacterium]
MTTISTSHPSSSSRAAVELEDALVRWTGRAEGDLGIHAGHGVDARRQAVLPAPWSWLHQVHGAEVVTVERPGAVRGSDGDALVGRPGAGALAIFTADCAPLALASPEGVIGVVHAGWRGLTTGVIEAAVGAMRALGATAVTAALGPCIRAECYEFGAADLDAVVARLGSGVAGRTATGKPALDVPAGVRAALEGVDVELVYDEGSCTACDDRWFSHRARQEPERQATIVINR